MYINIYLFQHDNNTNSAVNQFGKNNDCNNTKANTIYAYDYVQMTHIQLYAYYKYITT